MSASTNFTMIYNSSNIVKTNMAGAAEDVSKYNQVSVNYFADVNTNLSIQFSDIVPQAWVHKYDYTVLASTPFHTAVIPKGKWCRVQLTHTGTPTAMRISTVASINGDRHLSSTTDSCAITAASLPLPTGASTAAHQVTQTALLTTIDADTGALAGCVAGTELQVDIVSSALPTGGATLAEQQTQSTLLTTIGTNSTTLAGCVAGTELQVDVLTQPALAHTSDSVKVYGFHSGSSTNKSVLTDVNGNLLVDVMNFSGSTLPLPTGAASETSLSAANALLTTIDADTAALAACVGGSELQVDIISSALPSGAATETTLAAIKTQTDLMQFEAGTTNNLYVNVSNGPSGYATLSEQQAQSVLLGTIDADTGALAGCVAGTELQVDIVSSALPADAATQTTLAAIAGQLPATLGQKAMADSLAVTLASNQSAIPVSTAPVGTYGNLWNNALPNANDDSAVVDLGGARYCTFFGTNLTQSSTMTIWISPDNSNWTATNMTFMVMSGLSFYSDQTINARYVRVRTSATMSDLYMTVVAK
jgi:hypothetical protein